MLDRIKRANHHQSTFYKVLMAVLLLTFSIGNSQACSNHAEAASATESQISMQMEAMPDCHEGQSNHHTAKPDSTNDPVSINADNATDCCQQQQCNHCLHHVVIGNPSLTTATNVMPPQALQPLNRHQPTGNHPLPFRPPIS